MEGKTYGGKINIDKELWKKIVSDDKITDQKTREILYILLDSDGYAERGGKIGDILRIKHNALNGIITAFVWRILYKYPEIICPKYKNGKESRCLVPFQGEKRKNGSYWILRPELAEALKEMPRIE